jgi:hypothetical protein
MAEALAASDSQAFSWQEGPRLTVIEFWNDPSRAACDYGRNPWPRAELAAQRAYVLAARQVLDDEWDISNWIEANRPGRGGARIHGAETNCPGGHRDFPPHIHVFYLSIDNNGAWRHINSHHYPNSRGQIEYSFIIANTCDQTTSYDQPAGAWVNVLDDRCSTVWQQRYTTSGELQLRRSASSPTYTLRMRSISGDLSAIDIVLGSQAIYTIQVTEYDPLRYRMSASIRDIRNGVTYDENWRGDPASGKTLISHRRVARAPASMVERYRLPFLGK